MLYSMALLIDRQKIFVKLLKLENDNKNKLSKDPEEIEVKENLKKIKDLNTF